MIENVVWNTGVIDLDDPLIYDPDTEISNPVNWYNAERGNKTGKICTSGVECNDSVTRTTDWKGLVGLIYPSDYGYSAPKAYWNQLLYN